MQHDWHVGFWQQFKVTYIRHSMSDNWKMAILWMCSAGLSTQTLVDLMWAKGGTQEFCNQDRHLSTYSCSNIYINKYIESVPGGYTCNGSAVQLPHTICSVSNTQELVHTPRSRIHSQDSFEQDTESAHFSEWIWIKGPAVVNVVENLMDQNIFSNELAQHGYYGCAIWNIASWYRKAFLQYMLCIKDIC